MSHPDSFDTLPTPRSQVEWRIYCDHSGVPDQGEAPRAPWNVQEFGIDYPSLELARATANRYRKAFPHLRYFVRKHKKG